MTIHSDRLDLIPATPALLRAELDGGDLGRLLDAVVPSSWPTDLYDANATRWALQRIEADAEHAQWYFHYFLHRATRTLMGAGGYKGPPTGGVVELGYSILPEYRRCGYASEATRAFAAHAFRDARVERVIAHTLPDLVASIGVLEKCGFRFAGPGEDEGTIRYELRRT